MRNLWCEIDIEKIEDNVKKIRETTDKMLMAVVKAGAYGFGIEDITSLLDGIVDFFAVSSVDEALKVKSKRDILILYPVLSDIDIENIKDNFIITLDGPQELDGPQTLEKTQIIEKTQILDKLKNTGRSFRAHIYVDTGMNRFGIKPEKLNDFIKLINDNYPEITIEGIYTHLHNTKDEPYTINQIESFKKITEEYKDKIKYIHLLNSNGFLKYNSNCSFDNVVRVGNLLYGYDAKIYGYKKIFTYKATPLRVYIVNPGEFIGYGCYYRTKKTTRVGILDCGYIDNFNCSRNIKNNVFYDVAKTIYYHFKYYSGISYKGKIVHIIGKPNMNFTLIDMEGIDDSGVLDIDMSSITADSSIPKKYRKGDSYV